MANANDMGGGSLVPLLGAALPGIFRDDDQAQHLRPVGHNVPDDLAGFTVHVAA